MHNCFLSFRVSFSFFNVFSSMLRAPCSLTATALLRACFLTRSLVSYNARHARTVHFWPSVFHAELVLCLSSVSPSGIRELVLKCCFSLFSPFGLSVVLSSPLFSPHRNPCYRCSQHSLTLHRSSPVVCLVFPIIYSFLLHFLSFFPFHSLSSLFCRHLFLSFFFPDPCHAPPTTAALHMHYPLLYHRMVCNLTLLGVIL